MEKDVTHADIMNEERVNKFWIKVAGSILAAGLIAIGGLIIENGNAIVRIEQDMLHVKGTVDKLQAANFTTKDGQALKELVNTKLGTTNSRLDKLEKHNEEKH